MRVLFDVTHPAHVHFFRHAIAELEARGDQVAITARDKDITTELLDLLGLPYTTLSSAGRGLAGLVGEMALRDMRLWRFCRTFRPDVLTAVSGAFAAQTGWLLRRPAVVWDDTEHQKLAHWVTYPFATDVLSPDCYTKRMGPKHRLYAGTHELAYLHPERFQADPDVVRAAGVDPDERYCVVRFVGWGAHHDVGQHGLNEAGRVEFVRALAAHARPYITSEAPLPEALEPYRLRAPSHHIHHLLAFAALYVGEGATMASEAALVGTPAVYVNTLPAGTIDMFCDYGLMHHVVDDDEALRTCVSLLEDPSSGARAREALAQVLGDKVEVTALIVRTLEARAAQGR